MNYQNSSKSVAAKTPRKSRFTDVRKSLTAIIAIVIMLDPRFSRRSRSDLPLGSAATEHLCHLQLVDVVRHHFCRQCQIVHLFKAESKGLQTPYQQNHPEMRLAEDVETPSIPSMLIIALPEIVTLSILPFLQQSALQMVSTTETFLCGHRSSLSIPHLLSW